MDGSENARRDVTEVAGIRDAVGQASGAALSFNEELLNQIGDPEPLPANASREDLQEYKDEVEKYSREMLQTLAETDMDGEAVWFEFTSTFRQETIPHISKATTLKWIDLLTKKGVWVRRKQGYPRARALAECLTQSKFIFMTQKEVHSSSRSVPNPQEMYSSRNEGQLDSPRVIKDEPRDTRDQGQQIESEIRHRNPTNQPHNGAPRAVAGQSSNEANVPVARSRLQDVLPNVVANSNRNRSERAEQNVFKGSDSGYVMGISGLLKACQGRQKYGGGFDEDLQGALDFYDSMARICRLSENEKVEALPLVLCDDALSFYMDVYRIGCTYEEILQKIIDNYMNAEQRNRTLILWQSLRLSQAMRESPDKSELEVFRAFCHKLSQLQEQLDPAYRTDNFLGDQLIISADTTQISQSLRERVSATSQEARSRIATSLSNEPRSAESFVVSHDPAQKASHGIHYSLGNRYGGEALKSLKGQGRRKKTEGYQRRLFSKWFAGKKGCYVCGENHLARTRHSPQEIRAAIEKMRNSRPYAYVTVDDLAFIVRELTVQGEHEEDEANDVNFVYSSDSDPDESVDEASYIMEDEMELHGMDEVYLANASFIHGIGFHRDLNSALAVMDKELQKGECQTFNGIYIDTCANKSSVMSYSQYKAYCDKLDVRCQIDRKNTRKLRGLGGSSQPIGTTTIPIPFKDLNLVIDVTFQIVENKVPTLLCMKDMLDNGLEIGLQKREIMYKHLRQPLTFKNYFLIHNWKRGDSTYSLYTETELRKLHRAFGHPSAQAFTNLLRRARPDETNKEVREAIVRLTKECVTCTVNASRPRRFKMTIGTDDQRFNHIVAVDVMYINEKPVFHAVDEATHFNAALFLKRMTSTEVWKAFLRCWSRIYLGPPDFLRIDQGSNFVSTEFLDHADVEGTRVLPAPIESPSTMSHVERYHGPLRSAYTKIRDSLPRHETEADCLQMAVKSVNDTIGPEGLCPTLLVFGSIPRPARRTPAGTQLQRARAIDKAMDAVRKDQAKRRIAFGMKHHKGLKGGESSKELFDLPAGSPVHVYRESSKQWEGPFPFIHIDGETAVVQLPHRRRIFRSNVLKPATGSELRAEAKQEESKDIENLSTAETSEGISHCTLTNEDLAAMFGEQTDPKDLSTPDEVHTFIESRKKELQGLWNRATFEVVDDTSVPKGTGIYGSRWVDLLKRVDDKIVEKSRLVAQNYRDRGALDIATKSPTVSRLAQRIAFPLAAMMPNHTPYIRDISQAYIQSESPIERNIYLRPPPEMKLDSGKVLRVLKPLYGIPESGLHWYLTYHGHHKHKLGMTPTKGDPCLLYRRSENALEGVTILQVDDSFGIGTNTFLKVEDAEAAKFKSKPRHDLKLGDTATFNGVTVKRKANSEIEILQSNKLRSLKYADSQPEFASVRAQVQCIGCCTRPDLCAEVQLLASSVSNPLPSHYRTLKKVIERCHGTADVGLKFVPLDLNSLRLALFTDSSFANADGMKSQLGFVLLLVDGRNRCNIIHYGSTRCKRVARSVMAAEVHALVYGFDRAYVVKSILEELLNREILVDGFVDSRTVFNVVAKNGPTLEKRL